MADRTEQRSAGTEMRLNITVGGQALDLMLPGALLKIDVMPDGTSTIMAYTEPGTAVRGEPGGCITIGPAEGW